MKTAKLLAALVILATAGYAGWKFTVAQPAKAAEAQGAEAPPEMPPTPVDVAVATAETINLTVEAIGTVRAKEEVKVTSKAAGIVKRIDFQDGQRVETDALLVELDSGERNAELQEAIALRDDARRELARAENLLATQAISKQETDNLRAKMKAGDERVRAAEARLKDLEVRAPFSGRVGFREVSIGALVTPGIEITTLRSVDPIEVEFSVPESYAADLKTSLPIEVAVAAFPNRAFVGEVAAVNPAVDPVTRMIAVKALLSNEDEALKSGMFVNVTLRVGQRENAVVVPEAAVLHQGDRKFVYTVVDGKAVMRPVTLGQRRRGSVELVDGVKAGETVMITGLQNARDGMTVAPKTAAAGDESTTEGKTAAL